MLTERGVFDLQLHCLINVYGVSVTFRHRSDLNKFSRSSCRITGEALSLSVAKRRAKTLRRLGAFPNAPTSTLNYGVRDLSRP